MINHLMFKIVNTLLTNLIKNVINHLMFKIVNTRVDELNKECDKSHSLLSSSTAYLIYKHLKVIYTVDELIKECRQSPYV